MPSVEGSVSIAEPFLKNSEEPVDGLEFIWNFSRNLQNILLLSTPMTKFRLENLRHLIQRAEFHILPNSLFFLSVDRWQRNYLDQPALPNTYLGTLLWNEKT